MNSKRGDDLSRKSFLKLSLSIPILGAHTALNENPDSLFSSFFNQTGDIVPYPRISEVAVSVDISHFTASFLRT
jgi:hypothetical protein